MFTIASGATDFKMLNWVAETYASLGQGFRAGGNTPAPRSGKYFQKSADTFERILQAASEGKILLDERAQTHVRVRLASVQRELGDYEDAIENYDKAITLRSENGLQIPSDQKLHNDRKYL